MATEIELKAHVEEAKSLRSLLSEKAEFKFTFEKEDTYFFPTRLRLRSERRTLPDETEEFKTLLTRKQKEVRDGIEFNDEKEFEIRPSAHGTAAEFRELLEALGLRPLSSKRKRGWTFFQDDITAELLEVTGLGWFLELEILAENNNDSIETNKRFEEERQRLLDFLDSLGIPREAIESRFYSEMLNNKVC